MPPITFFNENTPSYNEEIWKEIIYQHLQVFQFITKLTPQLLERHFILTQQNGGKKFNKNDMIKYDHELDRFFYACILHELISEESINNITHKFQITRGTIQVLQMQAATFAMQSYYFCELNGYYTLSKALYVFKERLNFGIKYELIPLMKLPSCSKNIARMLIKNRIMNPLELSELNIDYLTKLISNNNNHKVPSSFDITLANNIYNEAKKLSKSLILLEELETSSTLNI